MPVNRTAPSAQVGPEPPLMTWGRASRVLAVCVIFDLLRLMCNLLWFLGPALAGTAAGLALSGVIGSWLASVAGGLVGIAGAVFLDGAFAALGAILAMAVAFAGWLTVGLWLLVTNRRIFHSTPTHKLWVLFGWVVSELPLIDVLPMMTFTLWRMYRGQIHREREEHKAWQARARAHEEQQEQERMALIATERARIHMARQAANDNDEAPVANDNEIPEHAALVA